MLFKIAWRNIWRNKQRSFVVITALAIGLWAGIFASAFVNGMMSQKIDSVIKLEMSHFQIHHKLFRYEYLAGQFIGNGSDIRREILKEPSVNEVAARTVSMVMISSSKRNGGIKISGVSPEEEKIVKRLHEKVVEGNYLDRKKKNSIFLSRETATKYNLKVGSKVVLTFQDLHGEIISAAFHVIGIFNTGNKMFDDANAFVIREDMQSLLNIGNGVHEVAVLLKDYEYAEPLAEKYQQLYKDLEVLSWMDLATGMRYMIDVTEVYTTIIVGIIMLALLFGIINTMLMSVLERVREIGMLMAVGMNRVKIFGMIMLETISLSLIGGPIGLLLAFLSIEYFGKVGIDLHGAAYGDLGFSNLIFPSIRVIEYVKVTVMVMVMTILAAIYPARIALRLKPVEAIRVT